MVVSRWRPILLIGLAISASGCAERMRPPPGGWLPELSEASEQAHGARVLLRLSGRPGNEPVQGELIALGADSVLLLTSAGLEAISRKRVNAIGIEEHRPGRERPFRNWSMTDYDLRARARFPTGFPPGVDRSSLLSAPADTLPPAPPDTL